MGGRLLEAIHQSVAKEIEEWKSMTVLGLSSITAITETSYCYLAYSNRSPPG